MACSLTQGFPLDCRDGLGGVKSIFVTEFVNLDTLTVSGGTVTAITLETGKQFWEYKLRKQTASFTEPATINDQNGSVFYNQEVSFTLTRLQANYRSELAQLIQLDVMVIVLDNTGSYWLLGTDKGLNVTAGSAAAGKAFGDLNGYTYTIGNGGESYPMLSLPSSFITALTAPAS